MSTCWFYPSIQPGGCITVLMAKNMKDRWRVLTLAIFKDMFQTSTPNNDCLSIENQSPLLRVVEVLAKWSYTSGKLMYHIDFFFNFHNSIGLTICCYEECDLFSLKTFAQGAENLFAMLRFGLVNLFLVVAILLL